MFKFKYSIQLKNNKTVELFGEDYFNDKKIFYEQHHSMLRELCKNIFDTGFPVIITDLQSKEKQIIESEIELKEWLQLIQPFFS